jgi:hypothetical protein
MVSPAREYSLEPQLVERLKFSGMPKGSLTDLVNIVSSLKNKCSIELVPPFRMNLLPRQASPGQRASRSPRASPRPGLSELSVTLANKSLRLTYGSNRRHHGYFSKYCFRNSTVA